MSVNGDRPSRDRVLDAIRSSERFILVTHENPDGDAIGSLVAMHQILRALGKDSVMYMVAEELPLPREYRFFDLDGLVTSAPADVDIRLAIFLDCGNIDRNPADVLKHPGAQILNIDHHHDNTLFGTVNHVVASASSTAEIVWDLMRDLDVAPTKPIAEALYVGLVTDTGKFMYSNTTSRAHAMAADLIEAGVDVHGVYRHLYEELPASKVDLLARGLANIRRFDDGRLTITSLSREDYAVTGAESDESEGVIDHLRGIKGTAVAALVRELIGNGGAGVKKVSLRSADGRVDVSRIAREQGGGGHPQAAGFSTDLGDEALVDFLRGAVAAQL